MHELTKKRLDKFKCNKRAYWSFKIFMVMFIVSLFSEFVCNDKPFFVWYKDSAYVPAFSTYSDKEFGGDFETEADYKDPLIKNHISQNGFMLMPLIEYSYTFSLGTDVLVAPSLEHPLGTDDSGRDIAARLLYGFRLSVLFGLALTVVSSIIGVIIGSLQGYFGGLLDILMQRFMEIWDSMPLLLVLIILSSIFEPTIISVFFIMLSFRWMGLVDPVRAEFLRARNFDYVRAARAIGVSEYRIIFRHILPNALVSSLSFLPFILTGSITILSILDYLGFGLQSNYPSLGELTAQGKNNLDKPWIGISAFIFMSLTLSLLVFVSEGVRDAFDPRKSAKKTGGTNGA
jgi:microcin C transport system permease protein